ncbi:MAG: hypothetical protein IT422_25840 [Pirellulaceae bacterium]|jgi:hypothetical protein|nr:hypothetical protein [Pirellulaceae bacterium]
MGDATKIRGKSSALQLNSTENEGACASPPITYHANHVPKTLSSIPHPMLLFRIDANVVCLTRIKQSIASASKLALPKSFTRA